MIFCQIFSITFNERDDGDGDDEEDDDDDDDDDGDDDDDDEESALSPHVSFVSSQRVKDVRLLDQRSDAERPAKKAKTPGPGSKEFNINQLNYIMQFYSYSIIVNDSR